MRLGQDALLHLFQIPLKTLSTVNGCRLIPSKHLVSGVLRQDRKLYSQQKKKGVG